jgi:transcription elongation factor
MLGDLVTVVKGNYNGVLGMIDWISPDNGWMWIIAQYWKGGDITNQSSVIVHLDEVVVSKPVHLLTFSKEKGYDVTMGDTLQIVRGELHGTVGIVRRVDFAKAVVELISDVDGCPVSYSG